MACVGEMRDEREGDLYAYDALSLFNTHTARIYILPRWRENHCPGTILLAIQATLDCCGALNPYAAGG